MDRPLLSSRAAPAALTAVVLAASSAAQTTLFEVARVAGPGAPQGFGQRVSLSGSRAVVATADFPLGTAHVLVETPEGWVVEAELVPASPPGFQEYYATAVALDGDVAVVGAPNEDFLGGAWSQRAKLVASDGTFAAELGGSIALSADTALVGAPGESLGAFGTGAAYVFEDGPDGWQETAKLLSPHPGELHAFGRRVALEGDLAAVGSPVDATVTGGTAGGAYLFERRLEGWVPVGVLADSQASGPGSPGDVALSGARALAGAPSDDAAVPAAGAVLGYEVPLGACAPRSGVLAVDPDDYACATPLVGSSTITTLLVAALGGATEGVGAFGFELLGLPPYLLLGEDAAGAFAVALPAEGGLVGALVTTQGARIESAGDGAVVVVLTNAQDVLLGL